MENRIQINVSKKNSERKKRVRVVRVHVFQSIIVSTAKQIGKLHNRGETPTNLPSIYSEEMNTTAPGYSSSSSPASAIDASLTNYKFSLPITRYTSHSTSKQSSSKTISAVNVFDNFAQAWKQTGGSCDVPLFGLEYLYGNGSREYHVHNYQEFFEKLKMMEKEEIRFHDYATDDIPIKFAMDIEDSNPHLNEMNFEKSCVLIVVILCDVMKVRFGVLLDPIKDFTYLCASRKSKRSMHIIMHNWKKCLIKNQKELLTIVDYLLVRTARYENDVWKEPVRDNFLLEENPGDNKQKRISCMILDEHWIPDKTQKIAPEGDEEKKKEEDNYHAAKIFKNNIGPNENVHREIIPKSSLNSYGSCSQTAMHTAFEGQRMLESNYKSMILFGTADSLYIDGCNGDIWGNGSREERESRDYKSLVNEIKFQETPLFRMDSEEVLMSSVEETMNILSCGMRKLEEKMGTAHKLLPKDFHLLDHHHKETIGSHTKPPEHVSSQMVRLFDYMVDKQIYKKGKCMTLRTYFSIKSDHVYTEPNARLFEMRIRSGRSCNDDFKCDLTDFATMKEFFNSLTFEMVQDYDEKVMKRSLLQYFDEEDGVMVYDNGDPVTHATEEIQEGKLSQLFKRKVMLEFTTEKLLCVNDANLDFEAMEKALKQEKMNYTRNVLTNAFSSVDEERLKLGKFEGHDSLIDLVDMRINSDIQNDENGKEEADKLTNELIVKTYNEVYSFKGRGRFESEDDAKREDIDISVSPSSSLFEAVKELVEVCYKKSLSKVFPQWSHMLNPRCCRLRRNKSCSALIATLGGTWCEIKHVMTNMSYQRHEKSKSKSHDDGFLYLVILPVSGLYFQRCPVKSCNEIGLQEHKIMELNSKSPKKYGPYQPKKGKLRKITESTLENIREGVLDILMAEQ